MIFPHFSPDFCEDGSRVMFSRWLIHISLIICSIRYLKWLYLFSTNQITLKSSCQCEWKMIDNVTTTFRAGYKMSKSGINAFFFSFKLIKMGVSSYRVYLRIMRTFSRNFRAKKRGARYTWGIFDNYMKPNLPSLSHRIIASGMKFYFLCFISLSFLHNHMQLLPLNGISSYSCVFRCHLL